MPNPFLFRDAGASFTFRDFDFMIGRDGISVDGAPVTIDTVADFVLGKIDTPIPPEPELPTIAETVVAVSGESGFDDNGGDFDILREALAATGLTDTVADASADFTVFAPTDAAFIQLAQDLGADIADGDEAGALSAILSATAELAGDEEEGLALVKNILLYHVAPEGRTLDQLQGEVQALFGPGVTVDGSTVIDAEPDIADPTVIAEDIIASNGVIQAIDRVLLPIDIPGNEPEPEPLPNIVDIAAGSPDFEILVKALAATSLVETVKGLEDATVFAPTDAAFTALAVDLGFGGDQADEGAVFGFLVEALTELGGGDPIPLLTDILLYHVSPGAKSAAEIDAAETIATANGATFATEGTELIDNEPDVANPNIVIADIAADNGTIQAIDRVLLPIDIPGNEETRLIGTRRDDVIEASDRDSLIVGRKGDDELVGGRGDDDISGGRGADALFGGAGNDKLIGGKGADTLSGGEGDDLLIGGRGADSFDFTELSGTDKVIRLQKQDTLVFSTEDFADFDALLGAVENTRAGAHITTEDGEVVLARRDIDADDAGLFEFV